MLKKKKKACYFQPLRRAQHLPMLLSPFSQLSGVQQVRALAALRPGAVTGSPACLPPALASPRHLHPSTTPLCPLLLNTLVSSITVFFLIFCFLAPSDAFFPLRYRARIAAAEGPDTTQNSLRQLLCKEQNSPIWEYFCLLL